MPRKGRCGYLLGVLVTLLLESDAYFTGIPIACHGGSYNEGETASLSCGVYSQHNAENLTLFMERYPFNVHPTPGNGHMIFKCAPGRSEEARQCNLTEGYLLKEANATRVAMDIPGVGGDQGGLYMCHAEPSNGTRPFFCLLTVEGISSASESGGVMKVWIIVSVFLFIATLCMFCILGFVHFRRRSVRKGPNDSAWKRKLSSIEEEQEAFSDQPLTPDVKPQVKKALSGFELSKNTLNTFMELLDEQMGRGQLASGQMDTDVKMLPTFVRFLPDGTESGEYLVAEFGSDGLLVTLVDLNDADMTSSRTNIPSDVKTATYFELFDFIAAGIQRFVTAHGVQRSTPLSLVFVFSFPCKQDSLTQASLTEWTMGFNCPAVVGKDIGVLLGDALNRIAMGDAIRLVAIVNDGVDTLLSVARNDQHCRVGLVIGNGFNACYMDDRLKHMIINTEWGGLGNSGCLDFIKTQFDKELDNASINPQKQTLEKMVSRAYMGELLRLVLVRLLTDGLLFVYVPSDCALFKRNSLDGTHVPKIESDTDEHYVCTKYMLREIGVDDYTEEDCRTVHYACTLISQRAANLTAAALAKVINIMDKSPVTVAVEGPVYRLHPHFKARLTAMMDELVNPCLKFKLVSSHGRQGIGAALAGAMATRVPRSRGSSLFERFVRRMSADKHPASGL